MDRLTTLVERFRLSVRPSAPPMANLVALADTQMVPLQVLFFAHGSCESVPDSSVLFALEVEWAGAQNPLLAALPDCVAFDLADNTDTRALVALMHAEVQSNRCGAQSVVNRLGEVLMVRLLRDQIERGATGTGLLAGLADPRLSRAIVAIHDHPGRVWSNEDLAQTAGLSLSRFIELFRDRVGETPIGYLRRWRLILARQDVAHGDRIDMVARRYAYGSPDSFTRAFRKTYGIPPTALRRS